MCSNVHVIEKPGVQPHPKTHSLCCGKKRLDIVAQLQVYVYVNSTPIFTYIIIHVYGRWKHVCYQCPGPTQNTNTQSDTHMHIFISEFTTVVVYFLWRVNSAGHICTVSGNLQSSPPQPRNWGGTKARLALWINPSLGLETPWAMFDG